MAFAGFLPVDPAMEGPFQGHQAFVEGQPPRAVLQPPPHHQDQIERAHPRSLHQEVGKRLARGKLEGGIPLVDHLGEPLLQPFPQGEFRREDEIQERTEAQVHHPGVGEDRAGAQAKVDGRGRQGSFPLRGKRPQRPVQRKEEVHDVRCGLVGMADERVPGGLVHVAEQIDQSAQPPAVPAVEVGEPCRHAVRRCGPFRPLHLEQAPLQQVQRSPLQDRESAVLGVQDVQAQPHQAEEMAGSVARRSRVEGGLEAEQAVGIHGLPVRGHHPIPPRLVQAQAILRKDGRRELGTDLPEQGQPAHFRDEGKLLGPAIDS